MESATPALAPTSETPTISAEVAAAAGDDFSAFDHAHQSTKQGKPLPRVEAPEPPATTDQPAGTAAAPERTLSKRQEEANARTRAAVDAATADLRAEVERLKASTAAPHREPAAPKPEPAPTEPEYRRFLAMPASPKLTDFDSVEEHAAAMSFFIAKTLRAEEQTAERTRLTDETRAKYLTERGQEYGERLLKAKEADPDIASKIAPQILAARPKSGLAAGERVTFANLVAETGLFSPDPGLLYRYLTEHADEAARIASSPSEDLALRALAQLDGRLSAGTVTTTATPPAAAESAAARPDTITKAPAPARQVTGTSVSDPLASALARDDFSSFDRIDTAARLARRGAA